MPRGGLLEATTSADAHLPPPSIKIITLATSPYRTGDNRNHTLFLVGGTFVLGREYWIRECFPTYGQPCDGRKQVEWLTRML